MLSKIKSILTFAVLYISVVGLVTFSCFILEESAQIVTFGTWPAKSAQNWEIVLEGCDLMESINITLKIINYSIGWIQPLAFVSYRAYAKGTDYYIKALKTEAFAKAPHVFIGREVKFIFTPKQIQQEAEFIRLINGRIHVLVKTMPTSPTVQVQGRLQQRESTLIIDTTS